MQSDDDIQHSGRLMWWALHTGGEVGAAIQALNENGVSLESIGVVSRVHPGSIDLEMVDMPWQAASGITADPETNYHVFAGGRFVDLERRPLLHQVVDLGASEDEAHDYLRNVLQNDNALVVFEASEDQAPTSIQQIYPGAGLDNPPIMYGFEPLPGTGRNPLPTPWRKPRPTPTADPRPGQTTPKYPRPQV